MNSAGSASLWELGILRYRFPEFYREPVLWVSIRHQWLHLYAQGELGPGYPVATSRCGVGSREGSYKTPLGVHRIIEKIGAGAPRGTVFVERRDTHRVAEIIPDPSSRAEVDLITTRILRLEGLEAGINRGQGIDSLDRYIYIHGTSEEGTLGRPASKGCVRMGNRDIEETFEVAPENGLVLITRG